MLLFLFLLLPRRVCVRVCVLLPVSLVRSTHRSSSRALKSAIVSRPPVLSTNVIRRASSLSRISVASKKTTWGERWRRRRGGGTKANDDDDEDSDGCDNDGGAVSFKRD